MKKTAKRIEVALRHAVVYPLMRLCLRNPVTSEKIDLQSVRRLLILRNDRIGDMIVSTAIFRKLKEKNPRLELGVFASPGNADIIRHNPFVDAIFITSPNPWIFFKELLRCKARRFDVVVNFVFNRTTSQGLIANFVAPRAHKVGNGPDKYLMYFNRLLAIDRSERQMVLVLAGMIDEIFGLITEREPLSQEVFVDGRAHGKTDAYLRLHGLSRKGAAEGAGSYAVVNFSAVDFNRRLSALQTVKIIGAIKEWGRDTPVLICPPADDGKLRRILSDLGPGKTKVFPASGVASLPEIASLVEGARYVVTCDTSIVHFAAAAKTPVLALYTPLQTSFHEWQPYGVRHKSLFAGRGLAVDSVPPEHIVEELAVFQASES
jgi:ADP-heptose:LPS heptosyltransferase